MTKSWMIFSSGETLSTPGHMRLGWRLGSMLLLTLACQGCSFFAPAPYAPQLDGTWTGRVERVAVFDTAGNRIDVAALRVEDGPQLYATSNISDWRPPYKTYVSRRLGPGFGDGELPLLARPTPGAPNAIPASELPLGKRIQFRGTMTVMPVCTPDGHRDLNRVYQPQSSIRDQHNEENAIWFNGAPRVLE
jgi:hypothetical protein